MAPLYALLRSERPNGGSGFKGEAIMVAQLLFLNEPEPNQAIGFAQGDDRLLFVAVDEPKAGRSRAIHAQVIDRNGNDVRFSGIAGDSIISLVSGTGAMLVGMLNEDKLRGSVVFADGYAQKFAVDLARI